MSGWTYDVEKPADKGAHGLTLRNVAHSGHHFADEIGVAAIWINPGIQDGAVHGPFVLGKDFATEGDVQEVQTNAPFPFDGYKIEKGIRQSYKRVMDGGPLAITQTYRLSAYGADPPHEPSGMLQAARIFPYVTFRTDNPKIESIRIDYRMNIVFTTADGGKRRTQAGVFRDRDHLPAVAKSPLAGEAGKMLAPFVAAQLIFADAEKPVPYELLAYGLEDGKAKRKKVGIDAPATWDNIHLWPKRRILPSTPGAFYAGHMHWRWSRLTGWPTVEEAMHQEKQGLSHPWQRQFRGPEVGGPLVDPKIPLQTIRFAIAKTSETQRTPTENFGDLFKNEREKPVRIHDGDDLEFWFSVEVQGGYAAKTFEGTVLLHGLYFAHELESLKNYFAFTIGKEIGAKFDFGGLDWERDAQP